MPVDCIVIGGGLVGSSVAYGISRAGGTVVLMDEGDIAFRASRANFGQVWVQGKGETIPEYGILTKTAAALWGPFATELEELTGVTLNHRQRGAFWFGFTQKEIEQRAALTQRIEASCGVPYRMVTQSELRTIFPQLGEAVLGGGFCPLDGDVNPLATLHALHAGLLRNGGQLLNGAKVRMVEPCPGGFIADNGITKIRGNRIILAAGLGNRSLGKPLGLHVPVTPLRGQVLVTERLQPFLEYGTNKLRQTTDGTVMFGSTEEEVGFNDRTSHAALKKLALRGIETFPFLAEAKLVRHWAGLRVMTPDGYPIYEESARHPGAFAVTCHSGVTLVPVHASLVGPWVLGATPMSGFLNHPSFSTSRFENLETIQ